MGQLWHAEKAHVGLGFGGNIVFHAEKVWGRKEATGTHSRVCFSLVLGFSWDPAPPLTQETPAPSQGCSWDRVCSG